jgi:hypothetical protein
LGLGPASPARSLVQASDPAGLQARVVQTTRALHRAKVNYLRPVLFSTECQNQMCINEDKRKALPGDSKAQATATVRALPENSPFLLLSVSSPLFLCFCLLGFLLTLCSPLLSSSVRTLWLNSGSKPKMSLALCLLPFVQSASGFFCSLCLFCSGFRVFLFFNPPPPRGCFLPNFYKARGRSTL